MKKNIIIISVIILVIVISIITSIIIFYNVKNKSKNEVNEKIQPQAISSTTQLIQQSEDIETKNAEIDKKIKTILYGILHCTGEMEEEYNEESVKEIVEKMTIKNGVYISEKARGKILNLIKNTTDLDYKVDDDGYLVSNSNATNEIAKKIEELISSDKCIVLDYNIYYYCVLGSDICTFNIEPSEYIEKFEDDNMIIMILNSSKYEEEYESEKDLINQIINNAV